MEGSVDEDRACVLFSFGFDNAGSWGVDCLWTAWGYPEMYILVLRGGLILGSHILKFIY